MIGIADTKYVVCRRGDSNVLLSHVSILHQLLMTAAVNPDPAMAFTTLNSQPVRQLVQLIAHVARASIVAYIQKMCNSMVEVSADPTAAAIIENFVQASADHSCCCSTGMLHQQSCIDIWIT